MRSLMSLFLVLGAACGGIRSTEDETLYLTGTEESPLTLANGTKVCAGKKELVCHIPPGNPANAHTICVSKNAVDTHVSHHADTIGACVTEPDPPPDEPPPQDEDPPPPPPPDEDPPPPPPSDDQPPAPL